VIYPAQTSLIPVQVALARFLEQGGNIFGNYPYWYLGTTPFRYLTGPILPTVLVGLHKVLPFLSLFEIMLGLVGVVWVVGGMGVYVFIRELEGRGGNIREEEGEKKWVAVLAAVFYVFGPMVPFLFRFADGLYLIAFSFLPLTLLLQLRVYRKNKNHRDEILLCLLIAFVILLDSLMIPTLLLGMVALFLAEVGWKKAEEKLKQTLLVISCSFLVVTLWYTPGYWLTLLGAPSLGGMGVMRVIEWLGKLLPAALAIGAAVFSVKFFKKRNLLRDFCFYWLFIFGFLSLLRFLSDPDFWLDWTAYGIELQFGLAILGSLVVKRLGKLIGLMGLIGLIGMWAVMTNKYVLGTFQRNIDQSVEYRIGKRLLEIAKSEERVFLSGTTAFWLNSFFEIPQVRGGKDQVAVDPNWRKVVWEVREFGGVEGDGGLEGILNRLKELKVSYLVVHTQESGEFYHDFVHPEKFEGGEGLEKIYEGDGDRIYRIED
jgi:hypothetical protein